LICYLKRHLLLKIAIAIPPLSYNFAHLISLSLFLKITLIPPNDLLNLLYIKQNNLTNKYATIEFITGISKLRKLNLLKSLRNRGNTISNKRIINDENKVNMEIINAAE